MRPCTLRIASAEDDSKATSLAAVLVEHVPCAEPPQPHSLYAPSLLPVAGRTPVVIVLP